MHLKIGEFAKMGHASVPAPPDYNCDRVEYQTIEGDVCDPSIDACRYKFERNNLGLWGHK